MKLVTVAFFSMLSVFFLSCKNFGQNSAASAQVTQDSFQSERPLFHYGPERNWINDPNGLVFNNGTYHLFYQYNPFSDKWGHMSWGHATSTDLMHWTEQPVAIPEFTEHDSVVTSIFSGTAFIDSFNTSGVGNSIHPSPMIAIYTGNITATKQLAQYQNMAYSLDNGQTFSQYKSNPVLDIQSKEFRDPKVFWYAPAKQWIMIVSKPDQHKVLFYGSPNLKTWKKLSEFGGNIGNRTKVWECPDIFELPVENNNGEKKWVITVSAGSYQSGFLAMQYFVGNFDGKQFKADPLPYPLYLDFGKDFYAGITYNDIPASDGRRIMIGWINCWEYANNIPSSGYRGRMSVPRKLSLMKTSSGSYELLQQPVVEYDRLKKEAFSLNNQVVDSTYDLSFHGNSYELDITIDASAAKSSGVKILKSKNEETLFKYDSDSKTLSLDRTKSGEIGFSPKFPSIESAPVLPENGVITLRILVDKTIVEVFVNQGQTTITDQVFPLEKEGGIQLFSQGGKTVFKTIKVFTIKM